MRALLLTTLASAAFLFMQSTPAQAEGLRFVPGNPNFIYNLRGYSYGSGTALPFTVPVSGVHRVFYWNGIYDPLSGFYYGAVSGHSSRLGFYSGRVIARPAPNGTYYNFIPSQLGQGREKPPIGRSNAGSR